MYVHMYVPHSGDLVVFVRAHQCLEPCRCINRTQCLGLFLSSTCIERMQWAESTRPSAMLEDNLSPQPIRAEGFVEHGQLLRCCQLF